MSEGPRLFCLWPVDRLLLGDQLEGGAQAQIPHACGIQLGPVPGQFHVAFGVIFAQITQLQPRQPLAMLDLRLGADQRVADIKRMFQEILSRVRARLQVLTDRFGEHVEIVDLAVGLKLARELVSSICVSFFLADAIPCRGKFPARRLVRRAGAVLRHRLLRFLNAGGGHYRDEN